jgi:hypothetical protein
LKVEFSILAAYHMNISHTLLKTILNSLLSPPEYDNWDFNERIFIQHKAQQNIFEMYNA